ncbi:MAG: ATP-binding protein [Candidatus Omnitrophica bacterium]|nr:ATP-binding protein [Candidatus Omnitrophota bacterium]
MKSYERLYKGIIISIILVLATLYSHAEPASTSPANPDEVIKIYRQIIKEETDPAVLAEAHFKIAEVLESQGKDNEATAEYLKIILNYPGVGEYAKSAEARLANLYNKFQGKDGRLPAGEEAKEETKDPAIFFTYIKSLYETYMDQGKYDKALYLIKKLLSMDSSNQDYYEDIGNIYLNGYNDPDTAMTYFNKVVTLNPNHPKVYTDLGLVYEKKNEIDEAIKNYRKGIELSPLNTWSMYGLARMEALELAKDKKLIRDWYVLGPFPYTGKNALAREYGPESNPDTAKAYTGSDGKNIEWRRPFGYDDSGYVDLNNIFVKNDMVVAYCLTYAYAEREQKLQFRIGTDDPMVVWLNGTPVFKKEAILKPAQYDSDVVRVTFKKGWNEILIKSVEQHGMWGFYFRITDEAGNTPPDIIFDPLKDNQRMKLSYAKLRKQEGFKLAKTTLLYGTSMVIFLSGVYLLLSNIHNKAQIREMKDDFIASVSHELKTPLAAIKMFTETLNMGRVTDPDKIKEYYLTIIRETDRLTRFINKILDFQKLEKGKKVFSFESVDIRAIIKNAATIYKNQVQDEHFSVEEDYADDVPDVEVDEDAMLQVFLNLLTNAYKYSNTEKYAKLRVWKDDSGVYASVTDHGVGIPKDKLGKLFDKFYRADREAIKDIKGSGIGLNFSKSVVEAHGGKIWVESELNKGSIFTIWLPH